MHLTQIKKKIKGLPYARDFPEICDILNKANDDRNASWNYVFSSCKSITGISDKALNLASAILCLTVSIHIIDDMLDNDPSGYYITIGNGEAANIVSVLQSLSSILVEEEKRIPEYRKKIIRTNLSEMMIKTSLAQRIDTKKEITSEKEYWDNIINKTSPLFISALFIGAVSGGATMAKATNISDLGIYFGKMIQIGDDLNDAFENKMAPDWIKKTNNLAILYALTANYPEKEEFLGYLNNIEKPECLEKAQDILITSGACSYCIYHMLQIYKESCDKLESLKIPFKHHLRKIADLLIAPTYKTMKLAGSPEPQKIIHKEKLEGFKN
jgi:geranylgeranyl pyrophosphate synthase